MLDNNLTEQALFDLIANKTQESAFIEFKASPSLNLSDAKVKIELSKDVASFANSGGGIIYYGIKELDNIADSIDQGVDLNEISKERIEQVIISNIQPRINDIKIIPISLDISSPGNFAIAIVIPESYTAHQSGDKKYYKRFNFLATAMEDYEIRDVMNRRKYSLIKPIFSYQLINQNSNLHEYKLFLELENIGQIRAHQIKIEIHFPTKLIVEHSPLFYLMPSQVKFELPYKLTYLTKYCNEQPIFPKEKIKLEVVKYHINHILFGLKPNNPKLIWTIYVDDSSPQSGEKFIEELQIF